MTCIAVDAPLVSAHVATNTFGHASMLDLMTAIVVRSRDSRPVAPSRRPRLHRV